MDIIDVIGWCAACGLIGVLFDEFVEIAWTPVEEALPEEGPSTGYWLTVENPEDGKRRTYEASTFWRGQFLSIYGDPYKMSCVKAWQCRDERPDPWEG